MDNTIDIRPAIREFVAENFFYRAEEGPLPDGQSFLDAGLIDSTGVLELVGFLEERFGIQVADAEILPANLDSIDRIARFVGLKRGAAPEDGSHAS